MRNPTVLDLFASALKAGGYDGLYRPGDCSCPIDDLCPYVYAWGPRFKINGLPVLDRKGQRCRVLARGAMNSSLVEFEDGEQAIVSRNALRRAKENQVKYDT